MKKLDFLKVKRIFVQAYPYRIHLAVLFFLNLLNTPVALMKPLALKILIDSAFNSLPLPEAIRAFFPSSFEFSFNDVVMVSISLTILIALIENLIIVTNWVIGTYVGEKLVIEFRTMLLDHVQHLSLAYHDSRGTSHSLYKIEWDTIGIRSLLLNNLALLVTSLITLVAILVVMVFIKWQFVLITLCMIPCLYVLTSISASRLSKDWRKVKEDEGLSMSIVLEILSALRVVKAFGKETREVKRFYNQADKGSKGQVKIARVAAFFHLLVSIVIAVGTALFIFFGARYVKGGEMTLGDLALVITYLSQIFVPLQAISRSFNEIQSSFASIDRVFSLLDEKKEILDDPYADNLSEVKGAFEFQHVSFSYGRELTTLEDVSFRIKAGDRVGITGSTGAGKTTLSSLLIRFYDPSSGQILIDGVDIRKYKLANYRNQFSIVLQEPFLFSATIEENILYARPEATHEDVVEAAKAANAHDFISNCTNGYQTVVGERGAQLSGGERQRISLARAFLKNAPVLILDEPTSSVDVKTEALIMDALQRLMVGKTTFMITHRLDTLNTCNIILQLEKGRLANVVYNHEHADTLAFEKKEDGQH